jgi:hypothetical protein
VTGRWFSPGTPVSSTNITDLHDINEILLKMALNTTKKPPPKKHALKPFNGFVEKIGVLGSNTQTFLYLF